MHTLKVTLKQHTPLIHFQHDQEGATLRASEVKPKLDRFILTRLGDFATQEQLSKGTEEWDDYKKKYNKGREDSKQERRTFSELDTYTKGTFIAKALGWLVGKGEHPALDYKMRIKSSQIDNSINLSVVQDRGKYYTRISNQTKDEFPFLLCNMGGKKSEEELMNIKMYNHNEMEILNHYDLLNNELMIAIPRFFALTNFGQRSTKGFGSFSVTSMTDNEEQDEIPSINAMMPNQTPIIRFVVNKENAFENQLQLFQVLDFYWKCLKSGVNYSKRVQDRYGNGVKILNPKFYIKPYLWTYLNQTKSKTWEKRLIKETFPEQLQTKMPVRKTVPNNNPVIFARGMMGCPMFFEYKVPNGNFRINANGRLVEERNEYRVNISNDAIERISSPIIFKPVISEDNIVSIYVLFDNDVISAANTEQSKTFVFSCEKKQGDRYVPIPNSKEVNIDISPSSIDYLQLIQKYHSFIGTDKQMSDSIFYGTSISGAERKFKMIPRNFRWDNILGQTGRNENLISFLQVKHN